MENLKQRTERERNILESEILLSKGMFEQYLKELAESKYALKKLNDTPEKYFADIDKDLKV
jgi:hypothetical protein